MVKLRLARQGRKKVPIFKIVATDSRSRRDGRFIESLGQYRPSNEPGQKVQLNEERTMYWLGVGAQPSDTVRSLLSKEGILLKWHLEKKKIEPARASEIFTTWKTKRDEKLAASADEKQRAKDETKRKASAAIKAKADAEAAEAASAAAAAARAEAAASAQVEAAPAENAPAAEAPQAVGDAVSAAPAGEAERPAESVEG
ncbi:MAG TPA: 30S ribosomal protein S16 [Candidatus Kapabacteria bacterium]|jgi:small subunit ribosomal protein S16